jgi:hypothetical protein
MERGQRRRKSRTSGLTDLRLAALIVTMSSMSGVAIAAAHKPYRIAQASNAPSHDAVSPNDNKPAESKPGGTRPTNPAPEPAHPDPEAEKQGLKPALPLAPAEKIGPPIEKK